MDWSAVLEPGCSPPSIAFEHPGERDSWLVSAFDELAALADTDAIVRSSVELARQHLGLERVAVFLVDESAGLLVGTWGTDLEGKTTDEHSVVAGITDTVQEALARAKTGIRWGVIDNCPIVVNESNRTWVAGRGWVAYTPILFARRIVAIMLNDSGAAGTPVDLCKQAQVALLCAFLGPLLGPWRPGATPARTPLVASVTAALELDPSLTGALLARRNGTSLSRLTRLFKSETGLSLVEYRNRLRLERFFRTVDTGRHDLLNAALDAGFGSYAQFHRVFRATHNQSPREYFRGRLPKSVGA